MKIGHTLPLLTANRRWRNIWNASLPQAGAICDVEPQGNAVACRLWCLERLSESTR